MKTEQNLTEFNSRVQRLRTVSGKTWADIATDLDVSRTTLHYYQRGQHFPNAAVLFRLERAEQQAGIHREHSRDYPIPGVSQPAGRDDPGTSGTELERHLRYLRQLLRQQQETIGSAQRHLREIEGWIADAEARMNTRAGRVETPDADAYKNDNAERVTERAPSPARRKEKRARLKLPPALELLRDIDTVSLPIFGHLPAGWPQTREGVAAQRPARSVPVKKGRFPEGAFGLEVRGESMNAATPTPILDGDIVVLLPPEQREPKHGDIVAALIDGDTCLKRLVNKTRRAHLRSESTNPAFKEIYPAHELVIQGVVLGKL